ncbi:N-acetylneuraminate synthase family protein [Sulfurospirillum arsenophilum]|uniref:N-acetylneuraminate synthase family protein n=1 Tax=Sulfurospirillum arsenophilum TaxID=56698 RepID=UPI0005A61AEB|nr:N-acetylneuraminate synthase family protein [Sulfurospirillum arsenophilum]
MNYYNSGKLDKIFNNEETKSYIIAEIGINHNGSFEEAIKLIDASVLAGADAVKFQKRDLEAIYSEKILNDANSEEWNFEYLIPLLRDCELSHEDYRKIRVYCNEQKIDLIITPFDEKSADFVGELGVSGFKIASADMTNIELIKKANSYGRPLLISTGMWEEKDIRKCAILYKKNMVKYMFLLSQSTYPAPYENLNLKFVDVLQEISGFVAGYSGHERGVFIPVACVAMGFKVIEKHITFDQNQAGPDHKASILPAEFKQMVEEIRSLESALTSKKVVNQAEILNKEAFAKSAVPIRDLPVGHVLIRNDVVFKSPGKGIFSHEIEDYFGKVLRNEVKKDCYINSTDFGDIVKIEEWEKFSFTKDWGIKCRFHDYEKYRVLNSPIVEFHCSETDLNVDFRPSKISNSQMILHAPEIFNRKLVDICSQDKAIVDESLDIIQRSIEKTLELSKYFPNAKPKMVVHLGGMFLNQKELCDTRFLTEEAIRNFEKLRFDKDKIDILPENLPPRPWYLGGEWFQHGFMLADDMELFCNHFGFKMTYDVCHAQLYCNLFNVDLKEYTKKIMPFVGHVHISDAYGNNGEGVQIDEGCIDFDGLFSEMENYQFSWVSEIWSGHLHEGAGTYECMKRLKKYAGKL